MSGGIVKMAARLYEDDVKILKKDAAARETDMSTRLRAIVHAALHPKMTIYRFWVGYNEEVVIPLEGSTGVLKFSGCLASAVAGSRDAAIALLQEEGTREGVDLRWLPMAKHVAEIPVDRPGRIAWAQ